MFAERITLIFVMTFAAATLFAQEGHEAAPKHDAPHSAAKEEHGTAKKAETPAKDAHAEPSAPHGAGAAEKPKQEPAHEKKPESKKAPKAHGEKHPAPESRPNVHKAALEAGIDLVAGTDGEDEDAAAALPRTLELSITGEGSAATATASGAAIPVLDFFARFADRLHYGIKWTDIEAPAALATKTIDLAFEDVPVVEALDFIAAATDMRGELDEATKTIIISKFPEASGPGAAAFHRKYGLGMLRRETANPDADRERLPRLLGRSADLALADGDPDGALADLESALQSFPKDPEGPHTCLRAMRAAIAAQRPADARRLGQLFMERWHDHEEQRKVEYLLAQSYHMEGRRDDAILLLERIDRAFARRDAPERDGLVAEFLLAQIYSEVGDHRHAIEILEQIPARHSRDNPDLLRRVPVYLGVVRARAGQHDEAIADLVVGAHEAPSPRLRMHALLELARCYLATKVPFEALAALRVVRKLELPADHVIEALRIEARAYADLGLDGQAVDLNVVAIETLAKTKTASEERRKLLQEILRDISQLLMDAAEFEAADKVIDRMKAIDGMQEATAYMAAVCRFRLGRYADALRELENVARTSGYLVEERRRLAGDCQMRLAYFESAVRTFKDKENQ